MRLTIFLLLALSALPQHGLAAPWMWAFASSSESLPVENRLGTDYAPVYEISQVTRRTATGSETVALDLLPGDIVRAYGQLQVSEDTCTLHATNCAAAPVYALLAYRIGAGGATTRFSPYVRQSVIRRENHHMPLSVAGLLQVTTAGRYHFSLQARQTAAAQTVFVDAQPYDGHLSLEIYRNAAQPDANSRALAQMERNAALSANLRVDLCPGCTWSDFTQIGDAVGMDAQPHDLFQVQGEFAADHDGSNVMVGQMLVVETEAGSWIRRAYLAPRENLTDVLVRHSPVGMLFYSNTTPGTLPLRVRSLGYALAEPAGTHYFVSAFTSRVSLLRFSASGSRFPVFAGAQQSSQPLSYAVNPAGDTPWLILHSQVLQGRQGRLRNADVVRAQGAVNLQFSAATGAALRCRSRLYLMDGTSPAYAPGQSLDDNPTPTLGFSAINLRVISGTLPSMSLPTFAAIEIAGTPSRGADATLVQVVNCDKTVAPDLLIPAGFSGLVTDVFRDAIFSDGFESD